MTYPDLNSQAERAEFEAWLRRRWPNAQRPIDEKTESGFYMFSENNLLWEAWQAARSVSPQSPDVDDARDGALEEAAGMADSVGHHWSGAPAIAFFDLAGKIRAAMSRTAKEPK